MTGSAPPPKRSRRLAVWLVLLLVVANLPIFVLALASGLAVSEEKVAEAKRGIERIAALAAAREAVAVARLSGTVDAVATGFGQEPLDAAACGRLSSLLAPVDPDIVGVRILRGEEVLCSATLDRPRPAAAAPPAESDAEAAARPAGRFVLPLPIAGDLTVAVELAARSEAGRLGEIELSPGETAAVVGPGGTVVSIAGDLRLVGAVGTLAETVDVARTRRLDMRLPDGRWMFVAAERIGMTSLTAVATAPLDAVQAAARRDLALAAGLPLAFLAIAVAVAWWGIDRLVVRWVGRINRVAALYGAGRQSVRVGRLASAPQEMRALATCFDEMADRVEGRSNELRAALAEKSALLRELHHRVKNNFQLIASLLSLEARDATPAEVRTLRTQQDRVHAMSIAYRLAYASGEVGKVPSAALVTEVVERMRHGAGVAERRLWLAMPDEAPGLDLDTAIPLALLLTEVVRPFMAASAADGAVVQISLTTVGETLVLSLSGPKSPSYDDLSGRLIDAFGRQLGAEVILTPPAGQAILRLGAA